MMRRARKIAVFGGTFDPIHFGHLIVSEEVRNKLGLEEVLFLPAGQPWLKASTPISPAKHRLEMVRLAIADNPHFELCTAEVDRPGPSYAVDTMDELRRRLGSEVKLFFLLGSDCLGELPRWKEPQRLIQLCRLVVFTRPGFSLPPMEGLELAIPGLAKNSVSVQVTQVDISATDIRRRVAQGAAVRQFVPPAVEDYILKQGLYRKPS